MTLVQLSDLPFAFRAVRLEAGVSVVWQNEFVHVWDGIGPPGPSIMAMVDDCVNGGVKMRQRQITRRNM